jgi:hypothetical protein
MAGGRRGVWAGALIVAATVVGLLAPAFASGATSWQLGDFKYVKKTVFLPFAGSMETTNKGVRVNCGTAWDIVSGGGDPKGLPGHGSLSESGFGGERHWFAEASHLDEEKMKFHGYATCVRDLLVDYATHLENVAVGPTSEGSSVECPNGMHPLGGGVRSVGVPTAWSINSLDPFDTGDMDSLPDDAWRAFMAYGGPTTSSFLVDVTCSDDLPAYRSKSFALPVDLDGLKAKVRCPAGTRVTGGGGFISGNSLEAQLSATKPKDFGDRDKVPDDGWAVRALNFEGADKMLTVHAVCL